MPPADETLPDFDSMTPEELMAWMETLAERQGATEGFTTEKRVDIAEVDPDTVQDTGPGYIPYGMSEEQWAEKRAKEEVEKQARLAAKKAAEPTAQAATQPVAEEPIAPVLPPEPVTAAATTGEMPDFDSMTPEELMAWMETLAERQGATEGFTTEKRVDIAEVDPDTVQDTGPGYIPYGMSEEQWAEKRAKEEAEKQARLAAKKAAEPKPRPTAEELLPPFEPHTSRDFTPPELELPPLDRVIEDGSTEVAPMFDGADANWLSNLVPNQVGDFPEVNLPGLDEIDLSSISDGFGGFEDFSLDALELPQEDEEAVSDPMDWLENLASSQGMSEHPKREPTTPIHEVLPPAPVPEGISSGITDPTEADVDPMEWLESLAQQQGVGTDELMTGAGVQVPPQTGSPDRDYTDYTVESEKAPVFDGLDALDSAAEDDPAAWLDTLAASVGHQPQKPEPRQTVPAITRETEKESPGTEDVMEKLEKGISDPQDMAQWMSAMLERGAERTGIPDYIETDEEEGAALEANIPDWLIEQVGGPPPDLTGIATAASHAPQEETPDWLQEVAPQEPQEEESEAAGIPDWLMEGAPEEGQDALEDIFITPEPEPQAEIAQPPVLKADTDIDTSDPWVEAFELERVEGLSNIDSIPDWYATKLGGEVEAEGIPMQLADAVLPPETTLPAGQLEPMPAWLRGEEAPASAFIETTEEPEAAEMPDWLKTQVESGELASLSDEELPDWLRESGIESPDEVPAWLLETVDEEPTFMQPSTPTPAPQPTPVAQAKPTPQPAPAVSPAHAVSPAPTPPPAVDVPATLQSARQKFSAGSIDEALVEYESVVRANVALDTVVNDLSKAVGDEKLKKNAAIHRVLGDGLMRQGRLQEALDTYRKALNLL